MRVYPAFEAALPQSKIGNMIHMHPDAKRAFFNDTGQQYNEEATKLAWERTLI